MRSVVLTVWFFLNVVMLGMCGYIYLIWLQYWRRTNVKNQQSQELTNTQQQPYVEYYDETVAAAAGGGGGDHTTIHQNTNPLMRTNETVLDKNEKIRLFNFKNKIIARLRAMIMNKDSGGIYGSVRNENPYNVPYRPHASSNVKSDWTCNMASSVERFRTLEKDDISHPLTDHIPDVPLFDDDEIFDTCAIISNAATLRNSNLGYFIDQHDLVLRFNNAPTVGYETDVGSKTTIRILNSQVVTKPQFQFTSSRLYKHIKLLMWDPSNYTSPVDQWIENPEHNFIENYISFRKANPKSNFHIVHPQYLWRLWDYIQDNTNGHITHNPPSSGFLGLAMLLQRCMVVNMFEFIPSERMTHKCHYYQDKIDATCTFGIWHPLAAEKLLMLESNTMNDQTVFRTGFISIPGYKSSTCGAS